MPTYYYCDTGQTGTTSATSADVWIANSTTGTVVTMANWTLVSNTGHYITTVNPYPVTTWTVSPTCRQAFDVSEQTPDEQTEREHRESEERAERLLLESLNPAQRVMYEQAKKFIVEGGETGTRYEVRKGRSINIHRLDDVGQTVDRLCAHPVDAVPDCDTMLAQKLMLETCEREFLRIANVHPAH